MVLCQAIPEVAANSNILINEKLMREGTMRFFLVLFVLIAFLDIETSAAQTDADRFAEGRVALDKFKDCDAAYKALSGVSDQMRKEAMWLYYMARTTECLKKYGESVGYYKAYTKLIPPNPELLDKIGEVKYLADKQDAEAAKLARVKDAQDAREQKLRSVMGKWQTLKEYPGSCPREIFLYLTNVDLKVMRLQGLMTVKDRETCGNYSGKWRVVIDCNENLECAYRSAQTYACIEWGKNKAKCSDINDEFGEPVSLDISGDSLKVDNYVLRR